VKKIAFLLLTVAFAPCLGAQQPAWQPAPGLLTLPLWPGAAPGAQANPPAEVDITTGKDYMPADRRVIRLVNVSTPTLTLYKSRQGSNTGAAFVVFPGGGYQMLAIDVEGTEVCEWLSSEGINCVMVKYRVPGTGPYPKSPAALQDAQRAVGLVREHAAEWGIDPKRVGVLGFSAGAHLAAALSTHYDQRLYDPVDAADKLSCRPDFVGVIYPGYLALPDKNFAANPNVTPTADTPPTFLVQAEEDGVHVENSLVYYLELKNAKVPAEMHIYPGGGHGSGLRSVGLPLAAWPQAMNTWLHTIGVLSK
jgi:acetyl esterase/lipase